MNTQHPPSRVGHGRKKREQPAAVKGSVATGQRREPHEIVAEAMAFNPVAVFVGFSGGDDSIVVTHWMMNNIPGCKVFHANTGIGVEATRQFVRDTCVHQSWPLIEIRAKEDCGQDYDQLVREQGFPGPAHHRKMYNRLKERPIRKLVRDAKTGKHRRSKVLIASGIRHDESLIRMGYAGREINHVGSQLWVNPMYWFSAAERDAYKRKHGLPRNPTSEMLGMSGECLCGAFAHPGELALIRLVCPETAARIDRLAVEAAANGHPWGWEGKPPRSRKTAKPNIERMPMCVGCEKIHSAKEQP